jgi:uncharacterized protein YecT (DUF1311 family)
MARIRRIASIAGVLALLLPPGAAEGFTWALEQEYAFQAFHDPGYLVLEDADGKQSELEFRYRDLPYAVLETWAAGRKIRVVYTPEQGTVVVDADSGERYPLASARPRIDALLERCLEQNPTTAGMASCQGEVAQAWDLELNRAYQRVMAGGFSDETKSAVRSAQRQWVAFRDASLAATRAVGGEKGGSIRALEAGSAAVALTRNRTLTLQSYLD